MLFVFAAIAMVNILIVMTSGRKRDFAQMRMLGASRSQVGQMVGWEALIVTLIACLIGGAISAVHLAPLSEELLGSWTPAMSWMQVGALAAIVLALALVATLLPTRRSLRQTPIEVIRA
jgi:putative ABC transport system permease protein